MKKKHSIITRRKKKELRGRKRRAKYSQPPATCSAAVLVRMHGRVSSSSSCIHSKIFHFVLDFTKKKRHVDFTSDLKTSENYTEISTCIIYISSSSSCIHSKILHWFYKKKKSRHVDFTSDVKFCTTSISVLQIVLQGRRMPPIGRVEFFN